MQQIILRYLSPFVLLVPAAAAQQALSFPTGLVDGVMSHNGLYALGLSGSDTLSWKPNQLEQLVDSGLAQPIAISNDGQTAVFNRDSSFSFGGIVQGPSGSEESFPLDPEATFLDASEDCSVILGLYGTPGGPESFLWNRITGSVTFLQAVPGTSVAARELSADGSIAAGVSFNLQTGLGVATFWDSLGMPTLLDPAAGASGPDSRVLGLSSDGTWLVGARDVGGVTEGFRWSVASGFFKIPAPVFGQPGDVQSASGVSDDGSSVVGTVLQAGQLTALHWSPGTGTVRLRDLVLARGASDPGNLSIGAQLSPDGTRVLCSGEFLFQSYWVDLDAGVSNSYCGPAVPNSTGQPGELTVLGSSLVQENYLFLHGSALPSGQPALALTSQTQGVTPMAGGSQGNLCLGGAIGRFVPDVIDASGGYMAPVNLMQIPTPTVPQAVMAGETWNFQLWHRDVGGTSNFTDGATVVF